MPLAVLPHMGNGALPGVPNLIYTEMAMACAAFYKAATQQLLQIGMLYFKRDYDDIMQVDFGINQKKITGPVLKNILDSPKKRPL